MSAIPWSHNEIRLSSSGRLVMFMLLEQIIIIQVEVEFCHLAEQPRIMIIINGAIIVVIMIMSKIKFKQLKK